MTDYKNVLPRNVVLRQRNWELVNAVLRARDVHHLTWRRVGEAVHRSTERARQIYVRAHRTIRRMGSLGPSPIEAYFADELDLSILSNPEAQWEIVPTGEIDSTIHYGERKILAIVRRGQVLKQFSKRAYALDWIGFHAAEMAEDEGRGELNRRATVRTRTSDHSTGR